MHPATIEIWLNSGVDNTAADTFICTIVLPWAEAADPPAGLEIVALAQDGSVLTSDAACR